MKIVTLRQFADAAGYQPPITGKRTGSKPTVAPSKNGPITLADLKVKPLKGKSSPQMENAYMRKQLLEDIRSFLEPLLDAKNRKDLAEGIKDPRAPYAEKFLKKAEATLIGRGAGNKPSQKTLMSNLEKKTVLDLFKGLRSLVMLDDACPEYDCSTKEDIQRARSRGDVACLKSGYRISKENKDLLMKARPPLPKNFVTEAPDIRIADLPTPPRKPAKLSTPSAKKAKFSSAATPTKTKSKSKLVKFFSDLFSNKTTKSPGVPRNTTPKFASAPAKNTSGHKKAGKA